MVAQSAFHQRRGPYIANGLAQLYRIPCRHGYFRGQAGILGSIAVGMADHHGHAHGLVLIDRFHGTGCCGTDRCPLFRGDVDAVVDPPVPGSLIIHQAIHGIVGNGLTFHRQPGLQRLLLGCLGLGNMTGHGGLKLFRLQNGCRNRFRLLDRLHRLRLFRCRCLL